MFQPQHNSKSIFALVVISLFMVFGSVTYLMTRCDQADQAKYDKWTTPEDNEFNQPTSPQSYLIELRDRAPLKKLNRFDLAHLDQDWIHKGVNNIERLRELRIKTACQQPSFSEWNNAAWVDYLYCLSSEGNPNTIETALLLAFSKPQEAKFIILATYEVHNRAYSHDYERDLLPLLQVLQDISRHRLSRFKYTKDDAALILNNYAWAGIDLSRRLKASECEVAEQRRVIYQSAVTATRLAPNSCFPIHTLLTLELVDLLDTNRDYTDWENLRAVYEDCLRAYARVDLDSQPALSDSMIHEVVSALAMDLVVFQPTDQGSIIDQRLAPFKKHILKEYQNNKFGFCNHATGVTNHVLNDTCHEIIDHLKEKP